MKKIIFYLSLLCFTISTFSEANKPKPKTVRFIYMVSKDRKYNAQYEEAIAMAAKSIQAWYKKQMNGYTFKLNEPIVETIYSNKNADFFYSNPNGNDKDSWGYYNTLKEAERLIGVKHFDENYIYVIYSDGPGDKGRGGSGICIMPEDDLLGLIGKHPTQKEINRWIAGLGHEGGHAFGLPHPADTDKDNDAIMWAGIYGKYPDNTYLTQQDKEILSKSPFFFNDKDESILVSETELAKYIYTNGIFTRKESGENKTITWLENTKDKKSYPFTEKKVDTEYYYLKSINRNIEIKIPIQGGRSLLSTDSGKSWRNLYLLEKEN